MDVGAWNPERRLVAVMRRGYAFAALPVADTRALARFQASFAALRPESDPTGRLAGTFHERARHYSPLRYGPGERFRWRPTPARRRGIRPLAPAVRRNPALAELIRAGLSYFPPARAYDIDVYQYRHSAPRSYPALRRHHDRVDYLVMISMGRRRVTGGSTVLYAGSRRVASRVLARPLSAVLIRNARIAHGVSPMRIRPGGHRDLLILAARRR